MDAIQELQNLRTQLIQEINLSFDHIIQNLRMQESTIRKEDVEESEIEYVLAESTGHFKGEKPVGVILPNGNRVYVRTWKKVVEAILQDCIKNPTIRIKLENLRGKVGGRERVFLADRPDTMRGPLKIDNHIFMETHYDTETLLRILTTHILRPINYDYSRIKIVVRNRVD
ncbi:MAG: hypothetical protein IJP31_05930 [Lachnospiraceae bacterium]|nr:hypothetical protein [Lachnospiraceae bacterium]